MKLVTFQENGIGRLGALVDDRVVDLNAYYILYLSGEKMDQLKPGTFDMIEQAVMSILPRMERKARSEMPWRMINFLQLGGEAMQRAEKMLRRMAEPSTKKLPEDIIYKLDDVTLKAPIPQPGKILCLAGNYAEHIREGGGDVPGKEQMSPLVFMKPNTAIIDPEQSIVIPKKGNKIDWEAELAVVIGKKGKYIEQDQAYDYVAGYTIMNDVSERELLIDKDREKTERNKFFDWLNGKWMDTFAPMGPCIVTKDEIGDPHNLSIKLSVNGEVKQDSNTGNMIFRIPELIEFASRLMTLEPGDIISTGTPSGVGSSTGRFLKDGDVVEVEIENIGVLRNTVEAE